MQSLHILYELSTLGIEFFGSLGIFLWRNDMRNTKSLGKLV